MVSLKELSAFFPAYNEEENVEKMCSSLKKILPQVAENFEIIIVNDGSKDRTKEIADRLAQEYDDIRTLHHGKNLGYGAAIQSGIKACRKEYLFFTDGDMQFDVSQLPQFVPHILNHDGVIGYRLNRRDPLIRKLNAWAWNRLVRLLFGLKVRDIDCAFKVFHRKVFEGMQLESSGNMISAEMLIKIKERGFRLQERGVVHSPRLAGRQTGADLRVILKAFKELFRFYVKFKEAKRRSLHPTETESMRV